MKNQEEIEKINGTIQAEIEEFLKEYGKKINKVNLIFFFSKGNWFLKKPNSLNEEINFQEFSIEEERKEVIYNFENGSNNNFANLSYSLDLKVGKYIINFVEGLFK